MVLGNVRCRNNSNSPGISEDFKREEEKTVDEDIMLSALKREGKSRHVDYLLPLLGQHLQLIKETS